LPPKNARNDYVIITYPQLILFLLLSSVSLKKDRFLSLITEYKHACKLIHSKKIKDSHSSAQVNSLGGFFDLLRRSIMSINE